MPEAIWSAGSLSSYERISCRSGVAAKQQPPECVRCISETGPRAKKKPGCGKMARSEATNIDTANGTRVTALELTTAAHESVVRLDQTGEVSLSRSVYP